MQTQNRLLDDLARVAGGALGVAAGMRGEIEARLREQFERILAQMDLVTRDEFEAVKAMAAKAREEQEELAERLAEIEAKLANSAAAQPQKSSPAKSSPAKSSPAKSGPAKSAKSSKGVKAPASGDSTSEGT